MPSFDLVAQLGHAGWGALIVLLFYVFFPRALAQRIFRKLKWWHFAVALLGLTGVLAWALPKEFIFDTLVEGATQANNLKDFAFYMVGAGSVLVALWVKGRHRTT